MDELIALLADTNARLKNLECQARNGSDAHDDEYTNGFKAGEIEGRQAAVKDMMRSIASRLEKAI